MKRAVVTLLILMLAICRVDGSANFVGAKRVFLERAEKARDDLAVFWTGDEIRNWNRPCRMTVTLKPNTRRVTSNGGGATHFAFDKGHVFGWRMNVEGPAERILDSVIPHEVNHTVIASLTRRPIPRWLDEGAAQLFEHPVEHYRHREMAKKYIGHRAQVFRMLDDPDYPSDMLSTMVVYSTGFTLVEWMLEQRGRDVLLRFILDKRPPSRKFEEYYAASPQVAERQWRSWLVARSSKCTDADCYIHAKHVIAKKPIDKSKPTLWIVGATWCIRCIPAHNDYRSDSVLRKWLQDRFNVVPVNIDKHRAWARAKGVDGVPAFVTSISPKVICGYHGKLALMQDLGAILAAHKPKPAKSPPTHNDKWTPGDNQQDKSGNNSKDSVAAPSPNEVIETNPPLSKKSKSPAPPKISVASQKNYGQIPWMKIALLAAGAAGVGIPTWGIMAWRGARAIKNVVHARRAARTSFDDQPAEHRYVVDAPSAPSSHRIDSQFVNIESDNYQRAHEQARQQVARRYPGSQEILEAELSLTRQFLAGQPPTS